MDFKELAQKSDKDLHDMLAEEREALGKLRVRAQEGALKKVTDIKEKKVVIAQIMTVLNQRKQK